MYTSMGTIALTITLLTIMIVYFVNQKNPFRVFSILLHRKQVVWHLGLLASILFINKLELRYESTLTNQQDYATLFYTYEASILANIQDALRHPLLTEITTFFYIIMFVTLIAVSLVSYLLKEDLRLFYTFIYAIGLNYIIAIPFYLFFPVNEAWYIHPQIDFLIPSVYTEFESQYRNISGLNNCFPSLHNSISLTLLLLSSRSSSRVFKSLFYVSVPIIMFSTIYLGIHWLSDMAAGIALAVTAVWAASLITERYTLLEARKIALLNSVQSPLE